MKRIASSKTASTNGLKAVSVGKKKGDAMSRCEECGGWCGEGYERCQACAEEARVAREEAREAVRIDYFRIHRETDAAVCLQLKDELLATRVWLPRSQIEVDDRKNRCVWIPLWLAEEKGL